MVVTGQRNHAAVRRGAGRVRMLERIHGTIDAGPLAVPDAEHAIDLGAREHADLLAAPHRGRRQILVEARLEFDVVLLQEGFRAPQRVVVHSERRAAITGDEARGVETLRPVAFALQHGQPDQRLRTRKENSLRIQTVLVVQSDVHQGHSRTPSLRSRLAGYSNRSRSGHHAPILLCVPSLYSWRQGISRRMRRRTASPCPNPASLKRWRPRGAPHS